jgi:restriction system protein
MKNTIKDAAVAVLQRNSSSLPVDEIYKQILAGKLYEFHAKEPISVLRAAIRKHSQGLNLKKSGAKKLFVQDGKDKYKLL